MQKYNMFYIQLVVKLQNTGSYLDNITVYNYKLSKNSPVFCPPCIYLYTVF